MHLPWDSNPGMAAIWAAFSCLILYLKPTCCLTAEGDMPIPAHLFDADGELDMAHTFCSIPFQSLLLLFCRG